MPVSEDSSADWKAQNLSFKKDPETIADMTRVFDELAKIRAAFDEAQEKAGIRIMNQRNITKHKGLVPRNAELLAEMNAVAKKVLADAHRRRQRAFAVIHAQDWRVS